MYRASISAPHSSSPTRDNSSVSSTTTTMTKVVIVGGGIGGGQLAHLLENDAEVTLVDSKEYFDIKWAGLRAYVEPAISDKIYIPHSEYLKKATVIVGKATSATDSEVTLEDGTTLQFDYLVVGTGSSAELLSPTVSAKKEYVLQVNEKLKKASTILIVGGGPVGVELAGEIVTDLPDKKVTIVHSGERLIEFLSPAASKKALTWAQSKGIEVLLNDRVEGGLDKNGEGGTFTTKSGKEITTDYLYVAIGSRPNVSWLSETLPDIIEDGHVKVDANLRVEGHPKIFALGDVTNVKENKQGYSASAHALVIAANIKKLLKKKDATGLKVYKASPAVGIVSLGRSQGLLQLPFGAFTGYLPTTLKSKGLFVSKVRKDLGLPA